MFLFFFTLTVSSADVRHENVIICWLFNTLASYLYKVGSAEGLLPRVNPTFSVRYFVFAARILKQRDCRLATCIKARGDQTWGFSGDTRVPCVIAFTPPKYICVGVHRYRNEDCSTPVLFYYGGT